MLTHWWGVTIAVHVGIDSFRDALEAIHPGNAGEVEVTNFFGCDVALSHLCAACADLLIGARPADQGLSLLSAAFRNIPG
jgi:hypothetical protein